MKKILHLQSKIITFNIIALLIIIIYTLINVINDGLNIDENMSIVVFLILFIFNIILYSFKYFNSIRIYKVSKLLILFVASYMAFNQTSSMALFYAFFSLLIYMELSIIFILDNHKKKVQLLLLFVVILLVAAISNASKYSQTWELFISILIILTNIYSFSILFSDTKNETLAKLEVKTKLFNEAINTNDQLRVSQNKFKLIHEEMAKQKQDLEVANKKLDKMSSEIYTQNELLMYISSALDINELLDLVTDAIMGTIGVDTCSLVLFDERNEEYLYSVKSNHPGDHLIALKENVEAGLLQQYFDSVKIHLNNRVVHKNYPFIEDRQVGSIAIIPLLRDGLTYGLLVAEHSNIDIFTENNLQFFRGISTQITIAINNANIYALMEEMAVKDGLTGIYNRKYLQDHIDELTLEAKENNTVLSVALFDIDSFKAINDKYGHVFGDEVIIMAGIMTQRHAKENNGLAIRYGGEEFVLVLPDCSMDQANTIAKKLHQDITNEALMYNNDEIHINVSIGITTYPDLATNGSELLVRADNAMYYSKEHGRGKITLDNINLEKEI